MDEYDPRRLASFKLRTLRLCPEEVKALLDVDPKLSDEDRRSLERTDAEPRIDQNYRLFRNG